MKEKYKNFVEKKKNDGEKNNENEESSEEEEINEEEFIKDIDDQVYLKDENVNYKYSPLKHCPVDQLFKSLIEISVKSIKKGGHMVCLFPYVKKKENFEYD